MSPPSLAGKGAGGLGSLSPSLVVGFFFLLSTTLGGCRKSLPPVSESAPPDAPARPGVYTDINPRWSRDGKRIAFLRATPDGRLQLHVVDEDLERPRALHEPELVSPDRPYYPAQQRYISPDTLAWSPDGREIAFTRAEWFQFEDGERLPGTALWSYDTYSGRVEPLALHPPRYQGIFYYFRAPQWSPDGRYIAFVGEGINGQRTLFVRPLAGQKPNEVAPRFDNYEDSDWPTWEPRPLEGRPPTLAFRQRIAHPLAAPPTETLRRLRPGSVNGNTTGEFWRLPSAQYDTLLPAWKKPAGAVVARAGHLAWSPDGRTIAFTLTPDANDYARYEVWIIRRDGAGARRVSPNDGRGYFAPVWINNQILGTLSPHKASFDAVALNLITGKKRALGILPTSDCDWSSDRRLIVYATPETVIPNPSARTTLRLLFVGL